MIASRAAIYHNTAIFSLILTFIMIHIIVINNKYDENNYKISVGIKYQARVICRALLLDTRFENNLSDRTTKNMHGTSVFYKF